MTINLRSGIGQLLFGMKEKDVKAVYGDPDRQFKDDDNNIVYLYNRDRLRLTFYEEEDFRLGYIISSDPALELFSGKVTGRPWAEVEKEAGKSIGHFEKETFDSLENYFNEDNWIIFQVEFGVVVKVELGAIINGKDEFEWKFKA